MSTNVLIISHDIVGTRMGGVGMRNWEMATVLSESCDVTLAAPEGAQVVEAGLKVHAYSVPDPALESIARQSDVILLSGAVWCQFPFLHSLEVPMVFDLSAPILHEGREVMVDRDQAEWHEAYQEYVRVLNEQLRRGDFFICASERQRDYYLGFLEANLRITPELYAQDRTAFTLIDVVPTGLSAVSPQHRQQVLRGIVPGIGDRDRIVLWYGGIWEWFDPFTPIRAVAKLLSKDPHLELKLVFLSGRHPNPEVRMRNSDQEAIALSRELGLLDRHVFFMNWVPYQERQNYLLEADVGIFCHAEHLETRYAFRTRMLDYLWTGLPMIVTEGDVMSDIVQAYDLGHVVAYGSVDGWVKALTEMSSIPDPRSAYAGRFEHARRQFAWQNVCQPLVRFCQSPHRAVDAGLYETTLECVSREKDRYIAGLEDALGRYHRSLVFRLYFALQRWFSKVKGAH